MTDCGVDEVLYALEGVHKGALGANPTLFTEVGTQNTEFVVETNDLTEETEVRW